MIAITKGEGLLKVVSPFNRDFVSFARMRGGKWSDGERAWVFDPRDEFAVRSTLIDLFGTDDYGTCSKIDVRLHLDHFKLDYEQEFCLFGRQLLRRKYADRLEVGEGVVTIEGSYPEHQRSCYLKPREGTVVEVRGVPQEAAIRAWAENREGTELLGSLDLQMLEEEKEALLKRIEQIDKMIVEIESTEVVDDLADLYD